MSTIDIYEAKTRLSQLVDRAASGEDAVMSRHGRPLARIMRLIKPKPRVRFGLLKGKLRIPRNFDEPLPDDTLAASEGR